MKYFIIIVMLTISITIKAQAVLKNDTIYAKPGTLDEVLHLMTKYYKWQLIKQGPIDAFKAQVELTYVLNQMTPNQVLQSFRIMSDMDCILSGDTLNVKSKQKLSTKNP